MSAPLIEPEDKQPDEKLELRLRPELARDLRAYGEYANGSSASHVIAAALKRLFREDKGFKSYRETNPNAGSAKVQNIRKNGATASKGAA
jgi:hypothetical protein